MPSARPWACEAFPAICVLRGTSAKSGPEIPAIRKASLRFAIARLASLSPCLPTNRASTRRRCGALEWSGYSRVRKSLRVPESAEKRGIPAVRGPEEVVARFQGPAYPGFSGPRTENPSVPGICDPSKGCSARSRRHTQAFQGSFPGHTQRALVRKPPDTRNEFKCLVAPMGMCSTCWYPVSVWEPSSFTMFGGLHGADH